MKIYTTADNLSAAKQVVENDQSLTANDVIFAEELNMNVISKITYVDGQCVYKNKEFWSQDLTEFIEHYDEHTVEDFMRQPVDVARFKLEHVAMVNQLSMIDGRAGEINYNIEVGSEFIANFRYECILTDFTTVSPLEIAQKLSSCIGLIETGSFREAKMVLQTIQNDAFLTKERIAKYIDMLDSADVIQYATAEDYYYKA